MSFAVSVEPSGRQFECSADETLLLAAIRQGIGLPYGCKDGACGSCKCRRVSGEVQMLAYQDKALSADELAKGLILACRAQPLSDVVLESKQVTAEGALPVRKMPARISCLERLGDDVMRVRLQLPAAEVFQYRAGQYVDVLMRDGSRRSYSMGNAAHTQADVGGIELHIRHMPGGAFTDPLFNGGVKEKGILRLEGPMGSFYLREDSTKPIVMVASGTGFAPIKALLEHMAFQGISRPTTVYWGGRRPTDLYLNDWMLAYAAQHPHVQYVPVISDALPEDQWSGRSGFVHQAVLDDFASLAEHEVYACGAPIVVDSARRDFVEQRQLDGEAFYADSFTSAADQN